MNIIIVGAGVVGSNIAEELSQAGHQVSVVDRNRDVVRRIADRMDVLALVGNAAQPSVLKRAGIETAEIVLAVTNIDEVNVVICMLAHRFGVKHKIARIRNDEYTGSQAILSPAQLHIDSVFSPEHLIADNLLKILDLPGSTDVAEFADGKVALVTFDVDQGAPVVGKRLSALRTAAAMDSFLVVAIFRGERTIIPRGDDTVEAGDHISVLANCDTVPLVVPLLKRRAQRPKRVVIAGAHITGLRVARQLEKTLDRVVIIERDERRAEHAARELEKTLVLHGPATEPDLLREADMDRCDFFMALSDDDEYNLLSALMARRAHAARVAVMAMDPTYVPLLSGIGLDVVVNPRLATVGEIVRYIRRGPVHHVTRLKEGGAEVLEMVVTDNARVSGKQLKSITFPDGAIIGAVVREGAMVIPDGNFSLATGDMVVVFCLPRAIAPIEKLFSRRSWLG